MAGSLGAIALDLKIYWFIFEGASVASVFTDPVSALSLLIGFVALSALGCLGGMFFILPFLRPLFSKFNGSSIDVGDEVIVLSGPKKGAIVKVYDIIIGQGGWRLVRLDFGPEFKRDDFFEFYSIYKIRKNNE